MITLTVEDRSGSTRTLEDAPSGTLMEAIRDNDIETEFALCGGCCSCATCHVILDEAHFATLSPASGDETDLLEGSDAMQPTSRLSCQVPLSETMDGASVKIAPMD